MKNKEIYRCTECGGQSPRWQGQCPSCGEWNTLQAETVAKSATIKHGPATSDSRPISLESLEHEKALSRPTGMESLDMALGGGLVEGAAVLLGGEPGIGKSTLLLQLAGRMAKTVGAIYISGEESLPQLKSRAERLDLLCPELMALSTSRVEDVLEAMDEAKNPGLVVVDSVQTMASPRADGLPGSPGQVRAVATELVERAKKRGATLVLVGHVTKDGQIAGPKLLEHMVDTVLYLEGDRKHSSRVLRVLKNRFGPCDELVVFTMKEQGLEPVPDPSTLFLGTHDASLSGTAAALALDGHRPFALEVQALAQQTFLAIPRRTALGLDTNRLNLLLAVLEKRLKLNLGQYDIYVKISGGLATKDPGLDLTVAAAVLSSFYDRPLPPKAVLWGEVDLNGQVRAVAGNETRLRQAKRLGFEAIHPDNCATLMDLQRMLFGRG